MLEPKPTLIPIVDVVTVPQCQDRVSLDAITVAEYRDCALEDFPPLRCYLLDGKIVLAAGHHTLEAHRAQGADKIRAIVIKGGTLADAILDAVKSNTRHGLRRTPADKRRAVKLLLETFPAWSTKQIADNAAVSAHLVEEVRAAAVDTAQPCNPPVARPEKLQSADGKKRPASKKAADKQRDKVAAYLKEYPGVSDRAAGKACGVAANTVRAVRKAAAESTAAMETEVGAPLPMAILDGVGVQVPKSLAEVFPLADAEKPLLDALDLAAAHIKDLAQSPRGALFARLLSRRYKTIVGSGKGWLYSKELDNVRSSVIANRPYACCPYCVANGKACTKDGCKGRGWLTEEAYRAAPKAVRSKYEEASVPL